MSRTAQLIVGAVTDFVMTAGATLTGYMMGQGGVVMPSAAMLVLAVIIGLVAAAKQVRGMAMDLKPLVVLLAVSLALTGCAGLGGPWTAGMSPEQLHEIVKIKDASVSCFAGTYAGARVNALTISADKGIPAGVQIDTDCKASFMSGTRALPSQ